MFSKLAIFLFLIPTLCLGSIWTPKHLRVLMHDDPSHEAHVVITIPEYSFRNKVKLFYGKQKSKGELGLYSFKDSSPQVISLRKGGEHLLAFGLKNLEPNQNYYFTLEGQNQKSEEYYFKTAPTDPDGPLALIFGGDSRSDSEQRQIMNLKMKRIMQENPEIIALVHGGDMVESGRSWDQWDEWLVDYQKTIGDDNRVLPMVPVRGNHETDSKLFNQIFLTEKTGFSDVYYVSKFSDIAIVNLNTNISHTGSQKRWLERTLKNLGQKDYWIIPNYHRPAFPAVKKEGRAKKHWVPLFEKYQVDFVFESDGHVLKRTAPVYKDKIDFDKGIVYLGEGGLGVRQRDPSRADKWYFQSPGYAYSMHHFFLLKRVGDKLQLSVEVPDQQKAFDTMMFSKKVRN